MALGRTSLLPQADEEDSRCVVLPKLGKESLCRFCLILIHLTRAFSIHIVHNTPPWNHPSSTPRTAIPIYPTRPARCATRPPHLPDLPHCPRPPPRPAAPAPSLPVALADDVGGLARPAGVDDRLHEVDEQQRPEEGAEDDPGDAAAVDSGAGWI